MDGVVVLYSSMPAVQATHPAADVILGNFVGTEIATSADLENSGEHDNAGGVTHGTVTGGWLDSFFFHRVGQEGSPAQVRGDVSRDEAGLHIELDILSAIGGLDVCWVVTGGPNSPVDLDIQIGMSHTPDFVV